MSSLDNRRVAKNTLVLYLRMVIVMLVSLYTSRVVLRELGVEDFGIYNLVGGVVMFFSFLNITFSVTIRRYLAVEMGKGDHQRLRDYYLASITSNAVLALLIVFLLTPLGLWFINQYLDIPEGRLYAAKITFILSTTSFFVSMLTIPYNSLIVVSEKMDIFAYLGILDVGFKLIIVYLLSTLTGDKLVLYATFLLIVNIMVLTLHTVYCEMRIMKMGRLLAFKRNDIKELFSFSGWSVLGGISLMLTNQGISIVSNMVWGVLINAAIGVSQQVSGAVNQFISNFQTAYHPQLTKSFAAERLNDRTLGFAFSISRITFLLLLVLGYPIIANIDILLRAWLVEVPAYACHISVIALTCLGIDGLAGPLYMLVYANGNVKQYQIILSIIQVSYVLMFIGCCLLGFSPVAAMSLNIVSYLLMFLARLWLLHRLIDFPVRKYFRAVFSSAIMPFLLLVVCLLPIRRMTVDGEWLQLALRIIVSGCCAMTACLLYSKEHERQLIYQTIKRKLC